MESTIVPVFARAAIWGIASVRLVGVIIAALHGALDGNVSYGGNTIPVYTRVIEWEDRDYDQYIEISGASLDEDGAKDTYVSYGEVTVNVFDFFEGKNEGSWIRANAICSSITQLIDQGFTLSGFTQVMGRVARIESPDYTLDDGGAVFQKIITYQFIIEED